MRIYRPAVLALVGLLGVGCNDDVKEDVWSCEDYEPSTVSPIEGMSISTLIYPVEQPIEDRTYRFEVRFKLEPTETQTSFLPKVNWSVSIVPKAHALSCIGPALNETITYIDITSDTDFDDEHLAGVSLNDKFDTYNLGETLADQLYGKTLYMSNPIALFLNQLPTLETTHTFKFVIELDSGKRLEAYSEEIHFTN